jgi:hypothetical protein
VKIEEGFAIIYKCKEAIANNKTVMTEEGAPAWLTESEGYWWGKPFYQHYEPKISRDNPPKDVVVFATRDEAERKFKEARKGNQIGPWYYKPSKEYEVIRVRRKYKTVPDGYEAVK